MKEFIIRTLIAGVLGIVSIGAWADDRVVVTQMENGTVIASEVAASGEVTVTLTVTPADNYYIEASDIVVSKFSNVAHAPRRVPDYANTLTVTAKEVDDKGLGTYEFTLPDSYGAYVEATFHACIGIEPVVDILGWTYGAYDAEANAPSVTGNTGNGDVTYTYAPQGSTDFVEDVPEHAGNYTVKASVAAAGHYLAGEATKNFTIAKAAGSIEFVKGSVAKTPEDAAFTNTLTHTGDGEVAYASSEESVATVDEESGEVTPVGVGSTIITATVTEKENGDYSYDTPSASYDLTVLTANVSLLNSADNSETLETYDGLTAIVTLDGRSLVRNGHWNTLCLPFDVTTTAEPLNAEGVVARVIDPENTNLSESGELTLTFTDAPAIIEAGMPFIIKWTTEGDAISNAVFNRVIVNNNTVNMEQTSTDGKVKFVGQYSPFSIGKQSAGDYDGDLNEIIYVGSNSKMGYASEPRTLNCFRAHFWVEPKDATAAAKRIYVDFGDGEVTAIDVVVANGIVQPITDWHTLDGRRLQGAPTQKGVYICNGKKFIIK